MSSIVNLAYPREFKPYEISWEQWAILWWKWCSIEPDVTNPAADATGRVSNRNQSHPHVWFLAGTFGGAAVRRCTVPNERSILFPIITNRISFAEHSFLKTEGQLAAYAKMDLDYATIYEATIDGLKLQSCRVRTNLFDFVAPETKCGIWAPESCLAISDGYWVFLRPLDSGQHTIVFTGEKLRLDEIYLRNPSRKPKFRVHVKYHLTVE